MSNQNLDNNINLNKKMYEDESHLYEIKNNIKI